MLIALAVFLLFAVLAGLAPLLAGALEARPMVVVKLILGLALFEALDVPQAVHVGMLLYPADLLFAVLMLGCLLRLTRAGSRMRTVPPAWWLIGAVQLLLFLWGLQAYGSRAGVDYRGHFYLWVALLYFSIQRWDEHRIGQVLHAVCACAIGFCLLTYCRWIGSARDAGYAEQIRLLDPTGVRFRVISSGGTIIIAAGFLISYFMQVQGIAVPWPRLRMAMMFMTVIVLQHRSVWISMLAGLVFLLWQGEARQRWRAWAACLWWPASFWPFPALARR